MEDERQQRALLAGLAVLAAEPASPELDAAVDGWLTIFGALAETLPPVTPPPALWDRVEAALPPGPAVQTGIQAMTGVIDGPWEPVCTGVSRRVLLRGVGGEPLAFLLRAEQGARVPAHQHIRREECVLIQGDIQIGGVDLRPGDFLVADRGSEHTEMITKGGMLAYVRYLDLPAAA